jgi:predicted lipid-binding transport protein (Tim44 family)
MDMDSIEEHVRAEAATELERLGSDRGLIALTDADLSTDTIRQRVAGVLGGLASVYEQWADVDGNGEQADNFASAAETARELAETAAGEAAVEPATGQADTEPATDHAAVAALDSLDDPASRAGAGLIALPLVLNGWALQAVSFFVNEADEAAADQFRTIRTGLDELVATGETAIESEDLDRATEAALDLVDAAYEDYVETLAGLGLDPKTVC